METVQYNRTGSAVERCTEISDSVKVIGFISHLCSSTMDDIRRERLHLLKSKKRMLHYMRHKIMRNGPRVLAAWIGKKRRKNLQDWDLPSQNLYIKV